MVDATVSKTVGHNARAGSTPALGTSFDSNFDSNRNPTRPLRTPEGSFRVQASSGRTSAPLR
jgi:hypothetical protein